MLRSLVGSEMCIRDSPTEEPPSDARNNSPLPAASPSPSPMVLAAEQQPAQVLVLVAGHARNQAVAREAIANWLDKFSTELTMDAFHQQVPLSDASPRHSQPRVVAEYPKALNPFSSTLEPEQPVIPNDLAGYLWKKGGSGVRQKSIFSTRGWHRRFFVLRQGKFAYYHSQEEFEDDPESPKFETDLRDIPFLTGQSLSWIQKKHSHKKSQENRQLLVLDPLGGGGSWSLTMGVDQSSNHHILQRWQDALILHYNYYSQ
eukprot:TRINITY_DN20679_c0_g1_i1.p1 TRINITY_DN20679_c0_g1~~TRINITY_DN20679_c0_g1_i1.p1  ORF type:complete len:259 (-),score=71.65 TRINITY_DN20679_c0_g1_i1:218-994(-)